MDDPNQPINPQPYTQPAPMPVPVQPGFQPNTANLGAAQAAVLPPARSNKKLLYVCCVIVGLAAIIGSAWALWAYTHQSAATNQPTTSVKQPLPKQYALADEYALTGDVYLDFNSPDSDYKRAQVNAGKVQYTSSDGKRLATFARIGSSEISRVYSKNASRSEYMLDAIRRLVLKGADGKEAVEVAAPNGVYLVTASKDAKIEVSTAEYTYTAASGARHVVAVALMDSTYTVYAYYDVPANEWSQKLRDDFLQSIVFKTDTK